MAAADGKLAEAIVYGLVVLIFGKERADRWRPRVLPYAVLSLIVVFVLVILLVVFFVLK